MNVNIIFFFLRFNLSILSNLFPFSFLSLPFSSFSSFLLFPQLSAGFIGIEEFHFLYAGTFLAINTFGGEIFFFLLLLFVARLNVFKNLQLNYCTQGNEKKKAEMKHYDDKIEKTKNKTDEYLFNNNNNDSNNTDNNNNNDYHGNYGHKSDCNNGNDKINNRNTDIILLLTWSTYRLSVLTMSCCCALLHRRHLMVWAVFAPKVRIPTW